MKKNLFGFLMTTVLLFVFTSGFSPKPVKDDAGIHNYSDLKKLFPDPPSEYRSAPLWDWNDKISEKVLIFT